MPSFEELTPDQQRQVLVRNEAMAKLLANPETSAAVKRMIKKVDPSQRFPELEVEDLVEARTSEQKKQIETLEANMMQRAAEDSRAKKHQAARDAGVDPEEVEKAIMDRKIGDWDTALEFVQNRNQLAAATPAEGHKRFDLPAGKDNDWWKDPTKAARKAAHDAIDELRGRRRA
jgi:hypothetical protein